MAQNSDYSLFEEISETELQETFAVFEALGITPAYAIKLFFDYVRKNHALPFAIEDTLLEDLEDAKLVQERAGGTFIEVTLDEL